MTTDLITTGKSENACSGRTGILRLSAYMLAVSTKSFFRSTKDGSEKGSSLVSDHGPKYSVHE